MRANKTVKAERWVLTFDSSCASCREISANVRQASAGKLEVLPLNRADVRSLRSAYFGSEPSDVPTLLRVTKDGVRGWTGPAIAPVLIRRLGVRSIVRVLIALGKLREKPMIADAESPGRRMHRAQFLRLCAGVAFGTGMLFTGRAPALAGAPDVKRARDWVAANKHALPQQYEKVASLPMGYRQEVFKASSPQVRSQLFVEQLTRYRSDHEASMTAQQRAALDRGIALFSNTQMFAAGGLTDDNHRAVDALRKDSIRAFGAGEATALFASLTPAASLGHAASAVATMVANAASATGPGKKDRYDDCTCADASDYCVKSNCYKNNLCDHSNGGCGSGWLYDCDGLCTG